MVRLVRILPSLASLNKLSGIISDLIALLIGEDKPLAILLSISYISVRDVDMGFYESIMQKKRGEYWISAEGEYIKCGAGITSRSADAKEDFGFQLFTTITMCRLRPVLDVLHCFRPPWISYPYLRREHGTWIYARRSRSSGLSIGLKNLLLAPGFPSPWRSVNNLYYLAKAARSEETQHDNIKYLEMIGVFKLPPGARKQ